MAEIESQGKIVTTPQSQPAPVVAPAQGKPQQTLTLGLSGKSFRVREFDALANETWYEFPLPNTTDFLTWSLEQQVGMLKRGVWNKMPVADIVWGLAYAHHIGADVIKGDLFPTGEGRWGTSNKYKIRKAMETGRIEGWTVDIRDTGAPLPTGTEFSKCVQKTDLECTVVLDVKGLTKPITRKAKLSRWYKANNPNWVSNPEHMLELNTLAHACEYVTGGTTGEDETPTVDAGMSQTRLPALSIPSVKELREAAEAEKRAAVLADVPLAQVVESPSSLPQPVPVG